MKITVAPATPACTQEGKYDVGDTLTLDQFNDSLWPFKLLLQVSGLHKTTTTQYGWFLRAVLWSCTVLCVLNVYFQTRAYRNWLFDGALSALHVWVSVGFEMWLTFMQKGAWGRMLSKQPRLQALARIGLLGYIGLVGIVGASMFITMGWLVPILESFFRGLQAATASGTEIGFLAAHGLLMIVIVIPWACVCITNCFLFSLLVDAHKSDMDGYHKQMQTGLMWSAQRTFGFEELNKIQTRLAESSVYFSSLVLSFLGIFTGLILASVHNVCLIVRGSESIDVHRVFQDVLYFFLGALALHCGVWCVSSIEAHWTAVVSELLCFGSDSASVAVSVAAVRPSLPSSDAGVGKQSDALVIGKQSDALVVVGKQSEGLVVEKHDENGSPPSLAETPSVLARPLVSLLAPPSTQTQKPKIDVLQHAAMISLLDRYTKLITFRIHGVRFGSDQARVLGFVIVGALLLEVFCDLYFFG